MQKKIVFTGGSGRFGQVFKKKPTKEKIYFPNKQQLNIENFESIKKYLNKINPTYLIHAAGLSRPMNIHEKEISKSININIIGTANIVKACQEKNIKLIYFSTNHVYPGIKGNYKEKDPVLPINKYAVSKLGGECSVQMYSNSLILRICMTEKPFEHKKAFNNMITNFIFHDEIAKLLPLFYKHTGIINIGGKAQSVYNFAKKYNSNIKGIVLKKNKNYDLKCNVSMNINKMKKILNV